VVRGDVGEALLGVTVAEFTGEICWVCELKSVYCEGDAVDCCTGIANSGAMALMGFFGVSTLSSSMEEVGGGWAGSASQKHSGRKWDSMERGLLHGEGSRLCQSNATTGCPPSAPRVRTMMRIS
jgi:hypothetical protein